MQAAIDRVMQTYVMLENLTPDEERDARERVEEFLANASISDEKQLAVEGIKFLRGDRPVRRRRS